MADGEVPVVMEGDEEAQAALNELDIDLFIAENDLNEKAAASLRAAPPATQRFALDLGPLEGIFDKSAGLMGRLHKARTTGVTSNSSSKGADAQEVEDFISTNWLNDRAAQALRSVPSHVQRMVIDRGSLQSCRDPSGGCLGRLRDVQQGKQSPQAPQEEVETTTDEQTSEVEQFIVDNGLHEQAALALRTVSPSIQRFVLDLGSLEGCNNRSAGCLGRINKAQRNAALGGTMVPPSGAAAPASSAIGPDPEEIEKFIVANKLNERAGEALRSVPGGVQAVVLDRGSLLSCRDPSAGCLGRIKLAQTGQVALPLPGRGVPVPPPKSSAAGADAEADQQAEETEEIDVEQFIFDNEIEGRAAEVLRTETPKVQRYVLGMGPLDASQNRSSGCLARISKFYRVTTQFAAKPGAPGAPGTLSPEVEGVVTAIAEVEGFISSNGLNDRAAAVFRAAPPAIQQAVIERGSLLGYGDPSGAILGRIRDVKLALSQKQQQEQKNGEGEGWWGGQKRSWGSQDDNDRPASKQARPTKAAGLASKLPARPPAPPPSAGPRPPTGPPPRATAEVRFDNARSARRAVQELHGSILCQAPIDVHLDPTHREGLKVIVRGLSHEVGKSDLREHFSSCGRVLFAGVNPPITPGSTITGEVRFETPDEALRAQPLLDGRVFPGGTAIAASFDRTSKDGTKVILRGLPGGTEWQELKDFCAQAGRVAFAGFIGSPGQIAAAAAAHQQSWMARAAAPGSGAVAEVRFETPREAQRAQAKLDKSWYDAENQITAELDVASKDLSKVIIRGLPALTEWQELKDFCAKAERVAFVEVTNCGAPGGWGADGGAQGGQASDLIGSVRFDSAPMALRALAMDGSNMRGAVVSVALDSGNGPARILVTGLPVGTRSQELKAMFSRYGRVVSADVSERAAGGDWF